MNTFQSEYDTDIRETFKNFEEQLEKQRQYMQSDLKSRLNGQKIPPKYWEFPELEKGNIHEHCAYCFDIHCQYTYKNILVKAGQKIGCGLTDCKFGCGAIFHACKASEHHLICPEYGDDDTFDTIYQSESKILADGTRKLVFMPTRIKKIKLNK